MEINIAVHTVSEDGATKITETGMRFGPIEGSYKGRG